MRTSTIAGLAIDLHRRCCRPWAIRAAWVVFVLASVGQVLLVAFAQ